MTAAAAAPLDPDLLPLAAACRRIVGDDRVAIVEWDDPGVDWGRFDAAVIRSTWDYATRHEEFLEWVDHVASATRLVNPAPVVRWSSDKSYLADLRDAGVAVAASTFVAPGAPAPTVDGLHVVKPTVGAGSEGARRCRPDEVADHVAELHAGGRTAIVQPYLHRLDELGETALCFVPGDEVAGLALSHAFRKGAILVSTEVEQEGDLFAKEDIGPRVPAADEVELAVAALSSAPVTALGELAYARVDVAPGPDGPVIMELELIEPSFYLHTDPAAADRFAAGLVDRLAASPTGQ